MEHPFSLLFFDSMKKLFFFDVETTGAIAANDSIIQFGAIF